MPLRDHFRGWLRKRLQWHPFHSSWATYISESLNPHLPEGFYALPNVQSSIEIDVAAFGEGDERQTNSGAAEQWQPSAATMTLPYELSERPAEVLVYGDLDGQYLAAAIELVSEGNKSSPAAREAFVSKCETYLQSGVGLIVVDLVTTRAANLHDALMARAFPAVADVWGERLYCTAYRPAGKNGSGRLDIWQESLALGSPLPTMPLGLLRGPSVPVDLETTYEDTFRRQQLPTEEP